MITRSRQKIPSAIILAAIFLISLTVASVSLADNDNRYRDDSSSVFSPGYLNAAKYQAEAIANQQTQPKSLLQNVLEYVQGKTEAKVEENAQDKPKPELKQKQSSPKAATKANSPYIQTPQGTTIITQDYKIALGSGMAPHYEGDRLISEYINGVNHIYVGFEKYGFASDGTTKAIQSAINTASAGDVIIVHSGTYSGDLQLFKDTKVFGGFDDNGNRVFSANQTAITGNLQIGSSNAPLGSTDITVLNGFTFITQSKLLQYGGKFELLNNMSTMQHPWVPDSLSSFHNNGSMLSTLSNKGAMPAIYSSAGRLLINGGVDDSGWTSTISTVGSTPRIVLNEAPSLNSADNISNQYFNDPSDKVQSDQYQFMTGSDNSTRSDKYDENKKLLGLKTGLSNETLSPGDKAAKDDLELARTLRDRLEANDLTINPGNIKEVGDGDVGPAGILAAILKNPAPNQNVILDAIKALLIDTDKIAKEAGNQSPELKKAQDDLLQAVANILLAQAVPDLLTKGDVSNIKTIFQELDIQKNKIMLDYAKSTKPYYENMIKDMAKNMAMLQAKNLLNPNITKDELLKLAPSELDKILDKIKNMEDKSFEEEYLLQQEAKYRKEYLDPNKKKLEEEMKGMLKSFTSRLSDVLKSADKR